MPVINGEIFNYGLGLSREGPFINFITLENVHTHINIFEVFFQNCPGMRNM